MNRSITISTFLFRSFSCSTNTSTNITRNIVIIAHVDAGKTTTTERMLFFAGYTKRIGHVDHGSTVTDFLPQEQERGITIQSAYIAFNWQLPTHPFQSTINLVDTPGHVDFTFEVERSLRVLDGAIVILDGVVGVQPQSSTVWTQANKYRIPRLIFVNKLDRAGASFTNTLHSITSKFNSWGKPVPIQIPVLMENHMSTGSGLQGVIDVVDGTFQSWSSDGLNMQSVNILPDSPYHAQYTQARENLIDCLSQVSDDILDAALDDTANIPITLIHTALRQGTLNGSIVPVLAGSSFKNIAVQPLMNAIHMYLPSPIDRPPVPAQLCSRANTQVMVRYDDLRLCVLAFKVVFHPKRGYMTYVRVYSGSLQNKQQVLNTSTNAKERINKLLVMYAADSKEIESLNAGTIGVILGLNNTRTGDTLCDVSHSPLILQGMTVPPPVFICSIEPRSANLAKEIELAFDHITREDPSVTIHEDKDTGQVLIGTQGELHLDIIRDRLQREYKLDVSMGPMQIAYRETITTSASMSDTFIMEDTNSSDSLRVPISLTVCPIPRESMLIPVRSESLIDLPSSLSRDQHDVVKTTIHSVLSCGPLRASPVSNIHIRITRLDLSPTTLPSLASSAVYWALTRILKDGHLELIEPIANLSVSLLDAQFVGSVVRDLNRRKARIAHVGPSSHNSNAHQIDSWVPLKCLIGYATDLRKVSKGSATFSAFVEGYDSVTE